MSKRAYLVLKEIKRSYNCFPTFEKKEELLFKEKDVFSVRDGTISTISGSFEVSEEYISKLIKEEVISELTFLDFEELKIKEVYKAIIKNIECYFALLNQDEKNVDIFLFQELNQNSISCGSICKLCKSHLKQIQEISEKESFLEFVENKIQFYFDFPEIKKEDFISILTYDNERIDGFFIDRLIETGTITIFPVDTSKFKPCENKFIPVYQIKEFKLSTPSIPVQVLRKEFLKTEREEKQLQDKLLSIVERKKKLHLALTVESNI